MNVVTDIRFARSIGGPEGIARMKRLAHRAYRRWAKTRLRREDPMLDAPPRTKRLTDFEVV